MQINIPLKSTNPTADISNSFSLRKSLGYLTSFMYRSPGTKIHVPPQLHFSKVNSQFTLFSVQGFCFSIKQCSEKHETSNKRVKKTQFH